MPNLFKTFHECQHSRTQIFHKDHGLNFVRKFMNANIMKTQFFH